MKEKPALFIFILLVFLSGCSTVPAGKPLENSSPAASSSPSQPEAPPEQDDQEKEPTLSVPPVVTVEEKEVVAADIEKLFCEGGTPTAIMKNGDLILWGGNVFYGIGNGTGGGGDDVHPFPPTRHRFPAPVVDAFSSVVSYAITENGDLYGWGLNYLNQLGQDGENILTPQKIDLGFQVKQVISPGPFSIYLSTDGHVYCTGLDITGYQSLDEYDRSLGREDADSFETDLRRLELPFRCQRLAASALIHVFLSEDGEVYYQGLLLGDHSYTTPSFHHETPEKIIFPEKIVDIAVTDFNVIALSESGKVYVYGHPLSGISDANTDIQITEDLYQKRLENIIAISSGEFTAMAISQEGRAYCWGLDMRGLVDEKNQTGDPPTGFELIPEPRDMGYTDVVFGAMGNYNGTILCKDGTAYIWGDNTIGQFIEFK